jgi:hypothetical protein
MPIFCEIVLEFGRPWVTRKGDVKLALGPYCRQHKSSASFFSYLPLAQSIFLRNRWVMPATNFGSCYAHLKCFIDITCLKVCIVRHKNLCMGSTKMCLLITGHILVPQLGRRRSRQYKMRTHCWFNPDLVSFKHYKFKVSCSCNFIRRLRRDSCPCKEYMRVSQSKLTNSWVQYRINWLVTKHLSAHGRLNPRGGLHCLWYPNTTWTPPIDAFATLKPVKNGIELKKLQPFKVQGVKNFKKKKQTNHQMLQRSVPKHSKKFLVCCFVPIRIQTWFVELQVTFL